MIKAETAESNRYLDAAAKAEEAAQISAHYTRSADVYSSAEPILEPCSATLDAKVFTIGARLLAIDNFVHSIRNEDSALRAAKAAQEKVESIVLEDRLTTIEARITAVDAFVAELKELRTRAESERKTSLIRRIRFVMLGV